MCGLTAHNTLHNPTGVKHVHGLAYIVCVVFRDKAAATYKTVFDDDPIIFLHDVQPLSFDDCIVTYFRLIVKQKTIC